MSSILSADHFHNEAAAYAFVEARLWPRGPVCPHCGATADRVGRLSGKSTRPGLCKCYACRQPFTVKVGTIMESSHVPMRIWLQAIYLMCSSKKGISTRQLQRTFKVGMKTAWFLGHRIREAMNGGDAMPPMGGEGKIIEIDETYFGNKRDQGSETTSGRPYTRQSRKGRGVAGKRAVVALVERGGEVRSFHMKNHPTVESVTEVLSRNVKAESVLHTDESRLYPRPAAAFAGHETVRHSAEEYVRGDVHTNTIEGYFSVFKRGMTGVYQHCSETHLHRYLDEFDFRYNARAKLGVSDEQRADKALRGIKGKRLTYRTTREEVTA